MRRWLFGLALVFASAARVIAEDPLVYVSVADENRIAVFQLDTGAASLKAIDSLEVRGRPGALALHPNRNRLYASIRSTGSLASFEIDEQSGKLQFLNEASAGADPSYVAVDRTGRYLLSAYYRAGKVAVHAIDSTGWISRRRQSIDTAEKAHAIVADPSNRFWFVPHTGPNSIFQFRFNADSGELAPNDPLRLVHPMPNRGPRHLWFHPSGKVAYSSDEQGRGISKYDFDASSGLLSWKSMTSTLPPEADADAKGSTSDIEVHPSGNYVYVANRGHDSIARFKIEKSTMEPVFLGVTPSEATTRSFNIDPAGRFLIAAGQKSGKLVVFSINPDTGDLNPKQTIEVGKSPWWVLVR